MFNSIKVDLKEDNLLLVCKKCSLPSMRHQKRCVHCGTSLIESVYEHNLKDFTLVLSGWYILLLALYYVFPSPEIKTVLVLTKIQLFSLFILDLFFIDFKSFRSMAHLKMRRWPPYIFFKYLKHCLTGYNK